MALNVKEAYDAVRSLARQHKALAVVEADIFDAAKVVEARDEAANQLVQLRKDIVAAKLDAKILADKTAADCDAEKARAAKIVAAAEAQSTHLRTEAGTYAARVMAEADATAAGAAGRADELDSSAVSLAREVADLTAKRDALTSEVDKVKSRLAAL